MITTGDKPFYYYPSVTIHPDEIFTYMTFDCVSSVKKRAETWKRNFETNRIGTTMSKKSKQKVNRAIKYLLYYSKEKTVYRTSKHSTFKFKVAFITLTLPSKQVHTDKQIKEECLNQFLIEARKKWNIRNYIWKAEKQQNGNIHFHILTDSFVPYQELRNTWNRIINKLGYVDEYRKKHHKLSPNSTDIHSLKKVKNIYSYISKYFDKQTKANRKVVKASQINYTKKYTPGTRTVSNGAKMYLYRESGRGRIYGTSYELSNITGAKAELTMELWAEIEKLLQKKHAKTKDKEYVTCYFFRIGDISENETPHIYALLESYVRQLFPDTQQTIDIPTHPQFLTV
jgi:hypothetical protein